MEHRVVADRHVGESLVFVAISILFLLVGPRLLVAWGGVSARFATAMLAVLSPTRLEATLLALESNGVLTARRDGPRTTYALR